MMHKADATAKYGRPAPECRAAHIPTLRPEETVEIDLDAYAGGVALWGAVPAVYDTTRFPMDRGIHVHAREREDGEKKIDGTFRGVRLTGGKTPEGGILISEIDAIYYMVSSIFQMDLQFVTCTYCHYPHLDKDWFSVHHHRRHLCAGCGRHFSDRRSAVGNPICGVREASGIGAQVVSPAHEELIIDQSEFPGGIQIWGSNPALLWTGNRPEAAGIHVHAFKESTWPPTIDETFGRVVVGGLELDSSKVRILMAQRTMPSLKGRLVALTCPNCSGLQFDRDKDAYTPKDPHICAACGTRFRAKGRLKKVVSNPLLEILSEMAITAPRIPQIHSLDLLPETL